MDSNLQIISGEKRGKKLSVPPNARPTQNRARVALFNMLNTEIPENSDNLTVWDAFAGSGAFGLEFLSRGWATTAIFTDTDATSINTIKKNSDGFPGNIIISGRDAIAAANEYAGDADIIFIDPPYDMASLGDRMIRKLATIARVDTIIVWEIDTHGANPVVPDDFDILKDRTYGRARFLILRRK